uniref:Piwi domain-containing protein n=1 Tax=Panagrellus redivivus TaxID=6233 RepID=A0A7E4VMN6_PANRE
MIPLPFKPRRVIVRRPGGQEAPESENVAPPQEPSVSEQAVVEQEAQKPVEVPNAWGVNRQQVQKPVEANAWGVNRQVGSAGPSAAAWPSSQTASATTSRPSSLSSASTSSGRQPPMPCTSRQPPVPSIGRQPPMPTYLGRQPPMPSTSQQPPLPSTSQAPLTLTSKWKPVPKPPSRRELAMKALNPFASYERDNPTPAEIKEQAQYRFPGTEGKPLMVKTNLFPMVQYGGESIRIGLYQLEGYHFPNDYNPEVSNPIPLQAHTMLSDFYNHFNRYFNDVRTPRYMVKGYPVHNRAAFVVFVVPPLPKYALANSRQYDFIMDASKKGVVIGAKRIWVDYKRNVEFNDEENVNDFQQLMKSGLTGALIRMFKNEYFRVGNDVFTNIGKKSIRDVIDILGGYKVRVHTDVIGLPMLSVNITFASTLRVNIPLINVLIALVCGRDISDVQLPLWKLSDLVITERQLPLFKELVIGLNVNIPDHQDLTVRYRNKIIDITDIPYFKIVTGDGNTAIDSYAEFGSPIQCPHLQAVCVKRGLARIYVPMEKVFISETPQRLRHSISRFKRDIVGLTAIPPKDRFAAIEKFQMNMQRCLESNGVTESNLLSQMKLKLRKAAEISARVLDPVEVEDANAYDKKLVRYIFLNLNPKLKSQEPKSDMREYVNYLREKRRINFDEGGALMYSNLQLKPLLEEDLFKYFNDKVKDILEMLEKKQFADFDPKTQTVIFFVLLPDETTEKRFYATGKYAITEAGYVSQFILPSTFDLLTEDVEVMKNLSRKINVKLGGTNKVPAETNQRYMQFMKRPTMFMGIDTRNSHQKKQRGVVAVSVTIDRFALTYAFYLRRNNLYTRYSITWDEIINDALDNFVGPDPERIYIYRAGMDEYNLKQGEAWDELIEIREKVENFWAVRDRRTPVPKITYIGYNRAHNVRFMRLEEPTKMIENEYRRDEGMKWNVPRGTVIDHTITPENAFFLNSHAVHTGGTVKPVQYIIVADENKTPVNDLEVVTYVLCCTSPRSDVPVKRPLPIAYCQLLLSHVFDTCEQLFDDTAVDKPYKFNEKLANTPFFV